MRAGLLLASTKLINNGVMKGSTGKTARLIPARLIPARSPNACLPFVFRLECPLGATHLRRDSEAILFLSFCASVRISGL